MRKTEMWILAITFYRTPIEFTITNDKLTPVVFHKNQSGTVYANIDLKILIFQSFRYFLVF